MAPGRTRIKPDIRFRPMVRHQQRESRPPGSARDSHQLLLPRSRATTANRLELPAAAVTVTLGFTLQVVVPFACRQLRNGVRIDLVEIPRWHEAVLGERR